MKKLLLYILLCSTTAVQATAPAQARRSSTKFAHHILLTAGGGIGSLGYDNPYGNAYPAYTWSAGLGYTWFFVPETGIQTGVRLSRIGSAATLTGTYTWPQMLTDASGDAYEHRMAFTNWHEQQEAYMLEIPLGFTLRHYVRTGDNGERSRAGVHAALGAKLQIPLFAGYTHRTGSVSHTGYYPYWDLTLHDLPGRFVTEQTDAPQTGSLLQHLRRWNAAVYMELGTTIRCSAHTELIITAYGQYTVTDMLATPLNRLSDLGFGNNTNGYTFMPEYRGLIGTKAIAAMHPWMAGLKLGLSIWTGKTEQQKIRQLRQLAEDYPEYLPVIERRDTVYIIDSVCPEFSPRMERIER